MYRFREGSKTKFAEESEWTTLCDTSWLFRGDGGWLSFGMIIEHVEIIIMSNFFNIVVLNDCINGNSNISGMNHSLTIATIEKDCIVYYHLT